MTTQQDQTHDLTAAQLGDLAAQLRVDSIRSSTRAGSGHPTSSMSAADVLAVLVGKHLHYDWESPKSPLNDHLIFSKGHASPLVYAIFRAVGVISEQELLSDYRRFGSRLQGHPTPVLPWVDVATGSLGQGLPDGVGIAMAGKYLDELDYRVWVLCGDSELAEGSIWEAVDKAVQHQLTNLVTIVDVNRLGQRGPTELGWDLEGYRRRFEGFGAEVHVVDGHDVQALDEALGRARTTTGDRPVVILAKTIKGRGFSEVEDAEGWHGKAFDAAMADRAIEELGGPRDLVIRGTLPESRDVDLPLDEPAGTVHLPSWELGESVATRSAYGQALVAVGKARPAVVALDGEVSNSTGAADFAKEFPTRFFEMYIAEQMMVAAATGMATRGYVTFSSTFAAFLTRAFDFIRMAAISGVSLRLAGSHAGVEIGADGPSQMALEDLAMMRAVEGSTVLYPSDAVSTASLVSQMADRDGISYLRTSRGAYPVLYGPDDAFPIGGSRVLRSGEHDQVLLVGAGVTVHTSLAAADILKGSDIAARVVDCYSVKPLDVAGLVTAARACGGRVVVTEDHHPEGGLGEAVIAALVDRVPGLHVEHQAVRGMPGSGTPDELLGWARIDAPSIAAAAQDLVSTQR